MPIVYANASGNWTAAGTWFSGSSQYTSPLGNYPTSSDIVYLNGKTVTIDNTSLTSSFVVQSIRATSAPISASGTLTLVNGQVAISRTGSGASTVELNALGDRTTSSGFFPGATSPFISVTSPTTVSTIAIRGDQQLITTVGSLINFTPVANSTVIREGVTYGSSAASTYGINLSNINLTCSVTGALIGGIGSSAPALVNSGGTILLFISGNLTAQASAAVSVTANGAITITGSISASYNSQGLISTARGQIVNVKGNLVNYKDFPAITAYQFSIDASSSILYMTQDSGQKSFQASAADYPSVGDVRYGVSFGGGTGTMIVPSASLVLTSSLYDAFSTVRGTVTLPSASNVIQGTNYGTSSLQWQTGSFQYPSTNRVLQGLTYGYETGGVGNSLYFVGTANTTSSIAQAVVNELSSSTNPVAVRLQNASTLDVTGNQISSYQV
jgi:hypothetical protein